MICVSRDQDLNVHKAYLERTAASTVKSLILHQTINLIHKNRIIYNLSMNPCVQVYKPK